MRKGATQLGIDIDAPAIAAICGVTLLFRFPVIYLALTAFRPPADVFAVLTAGFRFSF